MEALQVPEKSADTVRMEQDYRQMGCQERERHHNELRDEGYEWCPECGSVLVWDLPSRRATGKASYPAPVVTGDYPPITGEDLAATAPTPY